MPIITNFGDVVTVGNAAVTGTGTSSFAGPVTFAQGAAVTGSVSVTSSFFGVISGANTAAVSALTASTNVFAPVITTPLVNAATSIATTGFFGTIVGQNTASVTVLTASGNVNAPTMNVASMNVSTQANITFLNVSTFATLFQANLLTANITSANVTSGNVSTLNVSGLATLFQANLLTANITSANVTSGNVSTLNVSGLATLFQANVLTANLTSANIFTANVSFLNVSQTGFMSNANVGTLNVTTANILSLNVTGDANIAQNLTVRSNLYTSNIIMSSNLSTNTGFGNVYLTGNLVVAGNIFSIGGSVGSGSGTSQGVLYSLASNYTLGTAFATGTAGPGVSGYHVNLNSFTAEAVASVSAFTAASGMLKFATGGLYQVTCVVVGDQPLVKLAFGKTSSSSFPPSVTATAGYEYVYNLPVGSSPSTVITIPLTVQDVTQYYYLDVFFSTLAGTPSVLYPTRSVTAAGSAYGTYVQVGPFGNYLTSATGVASGLLLNCSSTTTLSSPLTSNTFRLALTSANGWTVNGTSTSLAVTAGGNFQISQVGIYEVSMCLNPSATPMMFGVGSLATDTAPSTQGPYLYQYAPMYTQDPTTVVSMPLNITDTSKYYYLDVIFPGTQATVTLSNVSTFVSLKPVGSYVSPSTNPWIQQGASVYYPSGPVGIGGVNPSLLSETLTVNGNTSFVGNVTVTSDASGSSYVLARRVPAGSLDVTQYVTGSVPLTTTTSLINNYLSNAATITSNTGTGSITQALYLPGTANSGVIWQSGGHSVAVANLALSNLFVEAWINPVVGSTLPVLSRKLGLDNDVVFYATSAGILTASVYNTSGAIAATASNSTALVSGTWYHVSASYQRTSTTAGTLRVFVNGGVGGTTGTVSTQPRVQPSANVIVGFDSASVAGQNLFVSLSSGTTNATSSTDGITWTTRTLPSASSWKAAVCNPTTGVFVAVAQGSTAAASSTDGITWTARTLPSSSNWCAVTVNTTTGVFVAVSSSTGTTAASSTDGITWTARTLPTSSSWVAVTCNPTTGIFLAIANGSSSAAYSTDGITWSQPTLPAITNWTAVTCNPTTGVFVVIARPSTVAASSTNGITWTSRSLPAASDWAAVTCNPTTGVFVATSDSSSIGASSTDGITWTSRTFPFGGWFVVTCNPTTGVFVSVSQGSTVAVSSTDGITWTSRTLSVSAGYAIASAYQVTTSGSFTGNVADVRVFSGSLGVPTATYTTNTAPFTQSAPSYATGMSAVGTANTVLALQSQYFPGASTSPYGPCLTLPGTVGSYYSNVNTAYDTNWKTNGFCLEAWVNYASFASSNSYYITSSYPFTIGHFSAPAATSLDWAFGALTNGQIGLYWDQGSATVRSLNTFSTITTGSWNHIMVQSNGSNVYMAINGVFQALKAFQYTPAGDGTIAPAMTTTLQVTAGTPLTVGQYGSAQGPNYAIAKARLTFGTSGSPSLGNVYSSGNFTPNPNFATVPAGATIAWSLESQYPLPTYPSFFDVPQLPQQLDKYGAEPVVVGGVTSNVLGPYPTTYPQFDSIRFDGTGYIDFGANASSSLTTNIWASNWTIEGWVYPTVAAGNVFARSNLATGVDLSLSLSGGTVNFSWGSSSLVGPAISLNQWTHIAATYDGTRANVYAGGTGTSTGTLGSLPFTPSYNTQIGGPTLFTGNLADVRVSNVARYGGTTYVVPTAPFTTDSSTLLLLKSLAGQTGTTLEIQGRGLNAVSLGATRSVQSYPPAPMSSYLLDTTSNASVTYGQGKYIVSASSERTNNNAWMAYTRLYTANGGEWQPPTTVYSSSVSVPGTYTGSVTTVDTLGNSYAGEWLQMQLPVSVLPSSYTISISSGAYSSYEPGSWVILGSRDGINWTLVATRTGVVPASWTAIGSYYAMTVNLNQTQAYNYWRMVVGTINSNGSGFTVPGVAGFVVNGTEESLCITSDSKVGVGIANPQRSLEVAGDLVVGGTISGGAGMGSFRNRIINGDMRIAQRGTSNVFPSSVGSGSTFYPTVDRFRVDYWFTTGSMTTTQQSLVASDTPYQLGLYNSLRFTINSPFLIQSSTYWLPAQTIEGYNCTDLNWGTSFGVPVTVSFWFRSNLTSGSILPVCLINTGSPSYCSYVSQFTTTAPGTWQYVTLTVPPPPNGSPWNLGTNVQGIYLYIGGFSPVIATGTLNTWQIANYKSSVGTTNWLLNAGNFIEFTGVQLERGTVATPFEVRNYAQELALCYRYYQQFQGTSDPYHTFALGQCVSGTQAWTYFRFLQPMRTPPTLTSNAVSNFCLNNAAGNVLYPLTALAINANDSSGVECARLDATASTAVLTAGNATLLRGNNTTSAYIGLNAEL